MAIITRSGSHHSLQCSTMFWDYSVEYLASYLHLGLCVGVQFPTELVACSHSFLWLGARRMCNLGSLREV